MTVQEALKSSGIDALDAEVLLAHLLGTSREWLITHENEEVNESAWSELVKRRTLSEPVAYITQNQEFYGRDFIVTPDVLIPRPATERLIDLFFDTLEDAEDRIRQIDTDVIGVAKVFGDLTGVKTVVDLCTGSGCIAVTLACETKYDIIATDISEAALNIARANAKKHDVRDRITFLKGDLLEPLKALKQPFIIITNPPYVPTTEKVMKDVADFEPHLALFGGQDGSEFVVNIYNKVSELKHCKGLVMECKSGQLTAAASED